MIVVDIKAFYILQKFKFRRFTKIISSKEWSKIFVFFAFLSIATILAVATYLFAQNIFSFSKFYPEFLEISTRFLLLSFFFLIFMLTIASSFISAIAILFVQDDDNLLLSKPLNHQMIFESRSVNLFIVSSWPVIVFGIPLLLAFTREFGLNFSHFLFSFSALVIIIVIAILISSIVSVLLASFVGNFIKKILKLLALLALPVAAWWVAYVLIPPGFFEVFKTVEPDKLNELVATLPISSDLIPSTWASNFVFYLRTIPGLAYINIGRLFTLALILSILTYWLVNKLYYYDLAKMRVGRFIAGPHDATTKQATKKPFPHFLSGISRSLFEKDIVMLSRSQPDILQGGFIAFIALLYFLLLGRIPEGTIANTLPSFSENFLIQINFGVVSFILTILALRFIFPAISLEGQSAWLIWSAPFSKKKLYWQKLFTGWMLLSIVAVFASILATLILKLNSTAFFAQLSIFLAASLGITSINLGVGTLLPNFSEKNPEKLSTSFGGILATFISLFYILIASLILFATTSGITSMLIHIAIWTISFGFLTVSSLVSLSKIESYEF